MGTGACTKTANLGLILGTHVVERENQFPQNFHRPSNPCHGKHMSTNMHTNKYNKVKTYKYNNKNINRIKINMF